MSPVYDLLKIMQQNRYFVEHMQKIFFYGKAIYI